MSDGQETPPPLESEDGEDSISIDEFVELYVEFRGVMAEKEKEKYGKTMAQTPVREAASLFKLWFIDMTDREMVRQLDLLDKNDDADDDDDEEDDDDDQSDPYWWKKNRNKGDD